MLILLISTGLGFIIGFLLPIVLGFINHFKFKWKYKKEPNKADTASGAVSFLLIVTVPLFSFIGFMIGLLYLFFGW